MEENHIELKKIKYSNLVGKNVELFLEGVNNVNIVDHYFKATSEKIKYLGELQYPGGERDLFGYIDKKNQMNLVIGVIKNIEGNLVKLMDSALGPHPINLNMLNEENLKVCKEVLSN